jgi:signal transduction histidine kinase
MSAANPKPALPLDLRDFDMPREDDLHPNVPLLLRTLAHETRLEVLRLLASGALDARGLSERLGLPLAVVRRHLRALAQAGLVRTDARPSGRNGDEAYQLAQHAVRLLSAALAPGRGGVRARPRDGRRPSTRVPAPPLACTLCDNHGFVEGVLDELNAALDDARQYHSRIQEMSSQVLTAHEAERKRIARELHDDTAQALTSILVRLHLLERSTDDEAVLHNAGELRGLTAAALDSVRRMAMDLRPAALDDLGLVPALQAYAEKYSQSWPVKVTVTVKGVARRLPADVELVLYRVAQEALTNVAKHAAASKAEVTLSRRRNEVTLAIEDDGVGFDVLETAPTGGSALGLFGMRERLALVGGDLDVQSARDGGTTIAARVRVSARRGKTGRAV